MIQYDLNKGKKFIHIYTCNGMYKAKSMLFYREV